MYGYIDGEREISGTKDRQAELCPDQPIKRID
jgi:hypothetical protein